MKNWFSNYTYEDVSTPRVNWTLTQDNDTPVYEDYEPRGALA